MSYIQPSQQEVKMDIVGYVESAKREYRSGEPVSATLILKNQSRETLFVLVPTNRAGGIHIEIEQGENAHVKDLRHEPEPGLQPERKLAPGEVLRQTIPMGEWLILHSPGAYIVKCAIPVEVYRKSLREDSTKHDVKQVTVQSSVHFKILAPDTKDIKK